MDQETFVNDYLGKLTAKMALCGLEPKTTLDIIYQGIDAMVKNDGKSTNEEVFWKRAVELNGKEILRHLPVFAEFYSRDFDSVKTVCGFEPAAAETVRNLKERGFKVILATNPFFPAVAIKLRLSWAGLEPEDFDLYTTYENSCHCKPTLDYYRDILEHFGLQAEECVMVGNDVQEDMVAAQLGMKVFLLTPCLINRDGSDISSYPHGAYPELKAFLAEL